MNCSIKDIPIMLTVQQISILDNDHTTGATSNFLIFMLVKDYRVNIYIYIYTYIYIYIYSEYIYIYIYTYIHMYYIYIFIKYIKYLYKILYKICTI